MSPSVNEDRINPLSSHADETDDGSVTAAKDSYSAVVGIEDRTVRENFTFEIDRDKYCEHVCSCKIKDSTEWTVVDTHQIATITAARVVRASNPCRFWKSVRGGIVCV